MKVLICNGKDYKRVEEGEALEYEALNDYHKDSVLDGWSLNLDYLRYLVGDDVCEVFASNGYSNMNIRVTHNKTGNPYLIKNIAVGCNNGDEGSVNIVYENDYGVLFVREITEFFKKFTLCE